MTLTVEQLVERSELATRVIAGAAGTGRSIGWAHVCELRDPWSWVGDGDLLMTTGLGISASADVQVEYVERLAAVGAAGVAVGENMNAPALHPRMLAAADRHALPLMITRYEIPFIALARAVADASTQEHLARIDQTERVYEVLRRSSAQGLERAALLGALEEVARCRLAIVDPTTTRRGAPVREVPDALARAVAAWSPVDGDEAPVGFDVAGFQARAALVPSPRPAALLAWTSAGSPPHSIVLQHMAAAVALHETRLFAERERSLRVGASLLAQILDQRIGAATARDQLASVGLGGAGVVLAACDAGSDGPDLHLLHHELGDAGVDHIMLHRPPTTYVLLCDDAASAASVVEALPPGATVGISDPVTAPADLPTAQRQARWALHRAQERRLPLLHHSDDLGDSVFLPGDRDDSRAAARRVLGDLLTYDATHDTHLIESLQIFLQENRSWQRAADRLHIHKQTLVYRMRRVEELTSRKTSDTADIADLWLALQAATASGLVEP